MILSMARSQTYGAIPTIIIIICLSLVSITGRSQPGLDSLLTVKPATEQEFNKFLSDINDNFYRGTFPDQNNILRSLIDSSLVYAKRLSYKKGLANSFYVLGHYYSMADSNERALEVFNRAMEMFPDKQEDIDIWLNIQIGFANVYSAMGYHRVSNEYNFKIITFNDSLDLDVENFAPTNNMALNFILMGSIEMAQKYYIKAQNIGIPDSHPRKKYYTAILNYNFAEFYLQQEIFDSALSFSEKGIKAYKSLNDSINVAKSLLFKLRVYIMKNQTEKAESVINQNLVVLKRLSSFEILSKLLSAKSNFNSGQYNLANSYTKECYTLLQQSYYKILDTDLILFFYKEIFSMFKDLGEYKDALEVFEKYFQTLSENRNQRILREAMENEVLFSTELKEKENQRIKEQNRALVYENQLVKQKERYFQLLALLSVIVTIVLIALFIVVMKSVKRKRKLRLEKIESAKAKEKILKKEIEISNIKLKSRETMMQITNNHLLQQGLLTQKFTDWLKALKPFTNLTGRQKIQTNLAEIGSFSVEQNWREFEKNFSGLYPGVLSSIRMAVPGLSVSDYRILCFMTMKMENSEISMITMQSTNSLRTAKYRLRKKLDVKTNEELILKLQTLTGNKVFTD